MQQEAAEDLEKKLHSKKTVLEGQNLTHHQAVLALLYITQSQQSSDTCEELSYHIARAFNKGLYFARRVVEWKASGYKNAKSQKESEGVLQKHSHGSMMKECR
jgi:hypothetical protein